MILKWIGSCCSFNLKVSNIKHMSKSSTLLALYRSHMIQPICSNHSKNGLLNYQGIKWTLMLSAFLFQNTVYFYHRKCLCSLTHGAQSSASSHSNA